MREPEANVAAEDVGAESGVDLDDEPTNPGFRCTLPGPAPEAIARNAEYGETKPHLERGPQ